ncbi:DUF4138 domain-containing protein [Elizabethkingia ursingii]
MKKLLLLLSLLIFGFGFSQVKKPMKKKYTPKKQKVIKKEISPIIDSVGKDKGQAPVGKVNDSIIVGNISQRKDTVIAKPGILGKSEVVKTDSEIAQQVLKKGGYISTRNFDTKGKVTAIFKGVYVYPKTKKIYFLLEIDNKSLIDYNIDMISFSKKNDKGESIESLENEDNNLRPIGAFPNQSIFQGRTNAKIVLVFSKFSISESTDLALNISEKNGDRDLQIEIKGKWFVGAKSIR